MNKLRRLITKELRKHPNWRLKRGTNKTTHYVVTNGERKIICACTPKQNQTVLKNLRQQIRKIENGIPL